MQIESHMDSDKLVITIDGETLEVPLVLLGSDLYDEEKPEDTRPSTG